MLLGDSWATGLEATRTTRLRQNVEHTVLVTQYKTHFNRVSAHRILALALVIKRNYPRQLWWVLGFSWDCFYLKSEVYGCRENWESTCLARRRSEFDPRTVHQRVIMRKYQLLFTGWFIGKPLQWNRFYFNGGKCYIAYRLGPLIIRVYYENTKTT